MYDPNKAHYIVVTGVIIKDGRKIFAVKSTMWLPIGCPEDIKKAEAMVKS